MYWFRRLLIPFAFWGKMPIKVYTSPYQLGPKYRRKLSLMRQYPRITNFLVFIWSDMLPQKLLPWFFYLSMFFELHHFGKLTVIGTFWAITHVVIWCYHWIMHKNILTFRIFCEILLFLPFPWQPDESTNIKGTHCGNFSQDYYTPSLDTFTVSLLYSRILHLPFWQSSLACDWRYSLKDPSLLRPSPAILG